MTKTLRIKDFMPTISSEQKHNISELMELHQEYIDALHEASDYSFAEYLNDNQAGDLGKSYDELYAIGVDFAPCIETRIVGWKETTGDNTGGRPKREYFLLKE